MSEFSKQSAFGEATRLARLSEWMIDEGATLGKSREEIHEALVQRQAAESKTARNASGLIAELEDQVADLVNKTRGLAVAPQVRRISDLVEDLRRNLDA